MPIDTSPIVSPADVMTIPETAKSLKRDQSTIWRKIERGELRGQFIAGRWLLRRVDVERLRESESHAAVATA